MQESLEGTGHKFLMPVVSCSRANSSDLVVCYNNGKTSSGYNLGDASHSDPFQLKPRLSAARLRVGEEGVARSFRRVSAPTGYC